MERSGLFDRGAHFEELILSPLNLSDPKSLGKGSNVDVISTWLLAVGLRVGCPRWRDVVGSATVYKNESKLTSWQPSFQERIMEFCLLCVRRILAISLCTHFLFAELPEIIHISDFFLYSFSSLIPLIFSQSHLLFVSSALSLFGV